MFRERRSLPYAFWIGVSLVASGAVLAQAAAVGTEFQVNTYTFSYQFSSAVASDTDGDFVVVWSSYGSSGSDTDGDSIQGRRYRVTGDVGDRVFFDRDFDGIQDGGETGLAGIPVHLFDSFSNLTRSTTTDTSGLYHFQPKPGQYYLQFELPSNQSFTPQDRGGDDSLDSDAEVLTGETDTFTVGLLSNTASCGATQPHLEATGRCRAG